MNSLFNAGFDKFQKMNSFHRLNCGITLTHQYLKKSHFLQELLIKLISTIHPAVEHNISKTYAIKKAMYLCNLEKIEGDYLEFGMFEGTSFIAAFDMNYKIRMNGLIQRKFWGYDSFSGFKYFEEKD